MENLIELQKVQEDIHQIKNVLQTLKFEFYQIKAGIEGNKEMLDTGIVGRIKVNQERITRLEERIEVCEKVEDRKQTYIRIIWTGAGIIGGGALTYLLKLFSHIITK